jgi:hypothetical protein
MNIDETNELWLNFLNLFFNQEIEISISEANSKNKSILIKNILELNIDVRNQWGYLVLEFEKLDDKKLFLNVSNLNLEYTIINGFDKEKYPSVPAINSSQKTIAFYDYYNSNELIKNRIQTFKSILYSLMIIKVSKEKNQ